MLFRLLLGSTLAVAASAQPAPAVEFANLREDVRVLTQRVGELTLRVEQLERENAELRARSTAADRTYATIAQLNAAAADLTQTLKATVAAAQNETLQRVAAQMEKLAKETNAALESLAKAQGARSPAPAVAAFSADYPKEGVTYTVQKGDTLAEIAKKTGAKQHDIINANKLADPSRIDAGQKLFIPGAK